jgi:hypothetical protein
VSESQPPTLPPQKPTGPTPAPGTKKVIAVSKVCPQCGGRAYKRVAPTGMMAFVSDRECKQCKTRYTPPTPLWAAIIFLVLGAVMAGTFGLLCIPIMFRLFESSTNGQPNMGGPPNIDPCGLVCPLSMCILGILSFVHGLRAVIAKK